MCLCDQSRYKFYVTFSELDFCVNTATDQVYQFLLEIVK